jgi:hypothetical protein
MRHRSARVAVYVASVLLFWFIAAQPAQAYIDPGSSSFIIQILIGAAAGGALAIATFWRRIVAFFRRNKDTEETGGAPDTGAGPTPPSTDVPPAEQ